MLIRQAHIFDGTGKDFIGDVRLCDNKIAEIGERLEVVSSEEIVEATGRVLLPGLVDAHTHIGGMNFSYGRSTDDLNEMTAPLTAAAEARYSVDPTSQDFQVCRELGVTTVAITPGSGNVINGLVCAVKTTGRTVEEMMLADKIALKLALGGNPTSTYGKRNQPPSTRMLIPAMVREFFHMAKAYGDKKAKGENPPYNVHYEAVQDVFAGRLPLKIHCTQHDIPTAIEIAKDLNAPFSLEHVWGGTDYLDDLIQSGADICFGPMGSCVSLGEARVIDPELLYLLDKAGLCCAIISDSPIIAQDSLIQHAGETVRQGLPYQRAIQMITLNPARIMGVEDRVGSIEVGKDADLALFEGIPTRDVAAHCVMTWQDGSIVYSK